MKQTVLSCEATPRNVRLVAGKSFGFLRTSQGDAFIAPHLLRSLQSNPACRHAEIERGDKGPAVVAWHAAPIVRQVPDETDIALAWRYARAGTLFDVSSDHPSEAGKARKIWHALVGEEFRQLRRDMEQTARQAAERKRWSGPASEVAAKFRSQVGPVWQASPETVAEHLRMVRRAGGDISLARVAARDLIREWRARRAAEEAARLEREQAHAARLAPHLEAARKQVEDARNSLPSRYWDKLPSVERMAELLSRGETITAAQIAHQQLVADDNDGGAPDTWGYAHGQDFEGGSW